jgi:hypothetical protein
MKIAESSVQFLSQHTSIEKHQKRESLTIWGPGEERVAQNISGGSGQKIDIEKEIALFTAAASSVELSQQAQNTRRSQGVDGQVARESEIVIDLNLRILQAMIERITGKKIEISSFGALKSSGEAPVADVSEGEPAPTGESSPAVSEGSSLGGLAYEYYESHYEHESTSFSSSGTILTEDGQEINFGVSLNMSRDFFSEESLSIRAGDALKDPLVINFSGNAAELTQKTFSFDIDNDGHENQISFLQPGSGFLALDKNGDNIINDGSELFGPQSGNGFQDLAAYDSDGNNWIDENDAIFDKLRIWTKDAEGNDMLFALGEKGIGAIYLDSAATLFSIKDTENNLLGQVQSTGIFLGEDGSVGTVQQVDLVA